MVDYSKSKIYKIEPINSEDEGDIYIGSTTKDTLAQRMSTHRCNYRSWKNGKYHPISSFDLFEKYGLENCLILLIESFPCKSKDELRSREGFYIKSMKCVNKLMAGRTQKEYYEENKQSITFDKKQYYFENILKMREQSLEYYNQNKEKCQNRRRKYYYEIQKQQPSIICDCGSYYKNKYEHLKTKKHQAYLSLS